MLDVYLGCCSIEMTTESLSVAAATFANGGICPITNQQVFPAEVVRSVLAETMACGMYDGAGRFMVDVGLPAKSGVSGCLMVMVPGLFGLATFSPKLNSKGNSARGVDFCKRLVNSYQLHMFDVGNSCGKIDLRNNGWKNEQKEIGNLAWGASIGDDNAKKIRDVFLSALFRIVNLQVEASLSSSKKKSSNTTGTSNTTEEKTTLLLSSNVKNVIKEKYKQTFGANIDDAHFQELYKHVQSDPYMYKHVHELHNMPHLTDTMKEIIFDAMIEVVDAINIDELDSSEKILGDIKDEELHPAATTDDDSNTVSLSDNERKLLLRIADLSLGMNPAVATLQFDRYIKEVGHRHDSSRATPIIIENCNDHHAARASILTASIHRGTMGGGIDGFDAVGLPGSFMNSFVTLRSTMAGVIHNSNHHRSSTLGRKDKSTMIRRKSILEETLEETLLNLNNGDTTDDVDGNNFVIRGDSQEQTTEAVLLRKAIRQLGTRLAAIVHPKSSSNKFKKIKKKKKETSPTVNTTNTATAKDQIHSFEQEIEKRY